MKANEKLCVEEGEHGVTMIVGKGDFPATSVIERSVSDKFVRQSREWESFTHPMEREQVFGPSTGVDDVNGQVLNIHN